MFSSSIHTFHYLKAKQSSAIFTSNPLMIYAKKQILDLWIVLKSNFSNFQYVTLHIDANILLFESLAIISIFNLYPLKSEFQTLWIILLTEFFNFFDMMFSLSIHTFHYLKAKQLSAFFTSNRLEKKQTCCSTHQNI